MTKKFDCNLHTIVFVIVCRKGNCEQVYLGETKQQLKSEHQGYVKKQGFHSHMVTLQLTGSQPS